MVEQVPILSHTKTNTARLKEKAGGKTALFKKWQKLVAGGDRSYTERKCRLSGNKTKSNQHTD